MDYKQFIKYNIVGGIVWIFLFTFAGYFFYEIPAVKKNFTIVIFAIIIISVMPAVIEYIRIKRASKEGKV